MDPKMHPDGDFKMPSLEELMSALQNMEGLTEEQKQELRENLMARANQEKPGFFPAASEGPIQGMATDVVTFLVLITVIVLIFAFFGYKLYKSLTARERRKEEKRQKKQQKKKK